MEETEKDILRFLKEEGIPKQGYGKNGNLMRVISSGQNIYGKQLYCSWYW